MASLIPELTMSNKVAITTNGGGSGRRQSELSMRRPPWCRRHPSGVQACRETLAHCREGMRLFKAGLVAVLLSLSFAAPVVAGPFKDGFATYDHGDYATALRIWRPLADRGDASAQFNLGLMYSHGQGVPQDYAAATQWYRKAADHGDPLAQTNLGVMYAQGQGVPKDYAESVKWFRKAAEQGNAYAQSNLGVMYAHSQGVPQDYMHAYMWFNLAAGNFPASDAEERDGALKNRDLVAAQMTPEQIAEGQRLPQKRRPASPRSSNPSNGWHSRLLWLKSA
jgi:hypothetical protein